MRTLSFLLLAAGLAAVNCFGAETERPTGPKTGASAVTLSDAKPVAAASSTPPAVAEARPAEPGLAEVAVAGVQITWFDPSEWEEANDPNQTFQAGQSHNYTLTLAGRFTGPVFRIDGSTVDMAVTDAGNDLMVPMPSNPFLFLHQHSENGQQRGKVFSGSLRLAMPTGKDTTIKKLSGKVAYTVVGKSKMLDLGLREFKVGAAGTEFEAKIVTINDTGLGNGKILVLQLSGLPEAFGEFKFYDEAGAALTFQNMLSPGSGNLRTFVFIRNQGLPAKGRIELELFDSVKKLEAPFKLENVPLFGRPVRPGA
jgi:hypothetical protein